MEHARLGNPPLPPVSEFGPSWAGAFGRDGSEFSELNTQPTYAPVSASLCTSRYGSAKADRYSFSVRLLHSLLHAGLFRRTRNSLLVHHRPSASVHRTHQSLH
jgi:hypothetical protein